MPVLHSFGVLETRSQSYWSSVRAPFSYPGYRHHEQHIPTAESALRAGPDGKPPLNMRNALIFQGTMVCAVSVLVFGLKGRQSRRERDEVEAGGVELDQTVEELPNRYDGSEQSKEA